MPCAGRVRIARDCPKPEWKRKIPAGWHCQNQHGEENRLRNAGQERGPDTASRKWSGRLRRAGVFVDGRGKSLQQNFAAVFLTPGIPDISAQDGRMRLREIFLSDIHVDGHSISPPDSVAMSLHNYSKRIIKASAFCW